MNHSNLKPETMSVRQDHASHVCLEYFRGDKWSEYLAFESDGLKRFRELTTKMERQFYRASVIPLDRAALSFLRAAKRAYLPGDGVYEIIMEVYIMAKTNGNKTLSTLSISQLVPVYNELAEVLGKPVLKAYKNNKASLLAKISDMQAEAKQPTKAQSEAKIKASEAAGKRLSGLEPKEKAEKAPPASRTSPSGSPKAKSKASKSLPAAKGPKQASAASAKGLKKVGIGAFCMELIRKGQSNEEVLAAVQKQFPDASTSASSIAWYRNKLKSEG